MLFALTESNEHLLIAAIVGLLTAVTTLVGVYTTILAVTRRQTRQLVGEPKAGPTGKPVAAPTLTDLAAENKAVQKAINGEGLGGKLDAVIEEQKRQAVEQRRQAGWQVDHDKLDTERHTETLARFQGIRGYMGMPDLPAGE